MSNFSLTEAKYESLLQRLVALETHSNDLSVAVSNLATIQQVKELLVIIQATLSDLEDKITGLENRVKAIEEEPLL
jgi:BMFP domain-containing protein YqiC